MALFEALDGSAKKNAASCFIKTCICGDVLKGVNKILIWMLWGNKSGARAQPTLPARTLSSSGLPSTFGSAGSSATPRPNTCRAGEGCMGTSSLWADYLLMGSGIKVYSRFYKVISNLVFRWEGCSGWSRNGTVGLCKAAREIAI